MKMKQIAIQVIFLGVGIFLATATNLALASNWEPSRETANVSGAPLDDEASVLTIQGFLTNASGTPLNGSYNMTIRIYDVSSDGTALCSAALAGVTATNGQFAATMYCYAVKGQQLWLGIAIGSDPEMTPRQPIRPTAYAMSLVPGAIISGTKNSDAMLHIENWGNAGRGLRVYAMDPTSLNYGIVGASVSPYGYGGYFYNTSGGVGLKVSSLDDGNDLILSGNANTTAGDDGILSSDPTYPSSDLILRTNDGILVQLDHDANGESADFQIVDKASTTIFNVNNTGDVTFGGPGISAYPRPTYDSGWTDIATNANITFVHALGGSVDNYVVDFVCKDSAAGQEGINAWQLGGDWDGAEFYGAAWEKLTATSVLVHRATNDVACPQVRLRIWVYK